MSELVIGPITTCHDIAVNKNIMSNIKVSILNMMQNIKPKLCNPTRNRAKIVL